MYNATVKRSDIEHDIRFYAADFETTTGAISKEMTRVWSFCYDEIGHYEPKIYSDISHFFEFCGNVELGWKKRIYFHNLKFDGEFILYSALNDYGFRTAIDPVSGSMRKSKDIIEKEIVYAISDVGQWYFISFVLNGCRIEIRDSLKLLPLRLEQIGKDICTKYKKTDMNYDTKASLSDCTPEDIAYIKNDVLVLSEALDKVLMLHDEKTPFGPVHSLTIGGACWQKFKETVYGEMKNISVKLNETNLPPESGSLDMDHYIRKGYRGGYCYVNEKYANVPINEKGFTADVNSLYPFAMCTKYSGFVLPYGKGMYVKGRVPSKYVESDSYYFYARINVSFQLRKGYVPTIQKKHSFMFLDNLYLNCSRPYNSALKEYVGDYQKIELTLAKDDFILFMQHYEIYEIEYLDYIVFSTAAGLCDPYIEAMSEIKIQATKDKNRGIRTISKLFSNNLYGQFSKSDNSSFKVAEIEATDGATHYHTIDEHEKKVTNIAIGAAITAHARFYQINTIQNNFEIFRYSDTDSLHCVGDPSQFKGKIDATEYGAYDIENTWKRARFIRQKTYIEECEPAGPMCETCRTHCNWNICAAGMTEKQKDYFRENHNFDDFKPGLKIVGGKLQPLHVKGGVILKDVDFTLK